LRVFRSAAVDELLAVKRHDLLTVEELVAAVDIERPRLCRQPESAEAPAAGVMARLPGRAIDSMCAKPLGAPLPEDLLSGQRWALLRHRQ
jgi:hypothetical protein